MPHQLDYAERLIETLGLDPEPEDIEAVSGLWTPIAETVEAAR